MTISATTIAKNVALQRPNFYLLEALITYMVPLM